MENKDQPAFPLTTDSDRDSEAHYGLTKREYLSSEQSKNKEVDDIRGTFSFDHDKQEETYTENPNFGKLNQTEEKFLPPDSDDICWTIGSKTFTRKEVFYLLWTQRAMISNDLKNKCGDKMTSEMYEVLHKPRVPKY